VTHDDLYQDAVKTYGPALDRLVRAYEMDPDKRHDLSQEVHFALWRSLKNYEARCSLRTWVYRVAHNTAATYIVRQRRSKIGSLVSLDDLDTTSHPSNTSPDSEERLALERLYELIHRLRPLDRQLMLLYLEDMDTASIAEITGISPINLRSRIHRIKVLLTQRFHAGGPA
jgi:RNA polymerase sigma-70 factor, ECF subfamily